MPPDGEYKGKAGRVDVFRGYYNRKFVYFFIGLKKYLPSAVRDIFSTTTRKPIRDPTQVETECITLAYCLHGFLAQFNNLEIFMKNPFAVGLPYVMRRLYLLIKIDTSVPKPFETWKKSWVYFEILIDDYTRRYFGDDEEIQEEFSNLISTQLKTAKIQISL